jgi:hypothetical protein
MTDTTDQPFLAGDFDACELRPGMVVLDRGRRLEIIGEQEPAPNGFGLPWFRFLAREPETGKEGYLIYGLGGRVTVESAE